MFCKIFAPKVVGGIKQGVNFQVLFLRLGKPAVSFRHDETFLPLKTLCPVEQNQLLGINLLG